MLKVNFYIVRHGFACSNLAYMAGVWEAIKSKLFYEDPGLTAHGVQESRRLGVDFKRRGVVPADVHYVFASCLSRAIETAYLMFSPRGERKIHVYPALRETGSNRPLPPMRQDAERLDRVDASIKRVLQRNLDAYKAVDGGNVWDFVRWFLEKQAPRHSQDGAGVVNVVVVSHGNRMMTDLGLPETPQNNACFHVAFLKGPADGGWQAAGPARRVHPGSAPPSRLNMADCLCN